MDQPILFLLEPACRVRGRKRYAKRDVHARGQRRDRALLGTHRLRGARAGKRAMEGGPAVRELAPLAEAPAYEYGADVTADSVRRDAALLRREWARRLRKAVAEEAERTNSWSLLWKAEAAVASLSRVLGARLREYESRQLKEVVDDAADDDDMAQGRAAVAAFVQKVRRRARGEADNAVFVDPDVPADDDEQTALLELADQLWAMEQQADAMFGEMKRWVAVCGGEFEVPANRPDVEGLDQLAGRVVEWLLWPRLQPSLFPLQRQLALYGPAGGGKTTVTAIVAHDLAAQARARWTAAVKTAVAGNRAAVEAAESVRPGDFLVVYVADGLRLRSPDPAVVAQRIRGYLNCVQFETLRRRRRLARARPPDPQPAVGEAAPDQGARPLGLFVIDNYDAIWASDAELARNPRTPRATGALAAGHYRPAAALAPAPAAPAAAAPPGPVPAAVVPVAPGPGAAPPAPAAPAPAPAGAVDLKYALARGGADSETPAAPAPAPSPAPSGGTGKEPMARAGGAGETGTAAGMAALLSLLGGGGPESELAARWPDVSVLRLMRYPWGVPKAASPRGMEALFVDLPLSQTRASIFRRAVQDLLLRNVAARFAEEERVSQTRDRDFAEAVDLEARAAEPDRARRLRSRVEAANRLLAEDDRPLCAGPQGGLDTRTDRRGDRCDPLPDRGLLDAERRLRGAVKAPYLAALANGADPGWRTLSTVISGNEGFRRLLAQYMALLKPNVGWVASNTGMSRGAVCILQRRMHLRISEIEQFLIVTGRRGMRGDGIFGQAPFGFTVDELYRYVRLLTRAVATRQLHEALGNAHAFVYGSVTLAAPGCRITAREAALRRGRAPEPDALARPAAGTLIAADAAARGYWRAPAPGEPAIVEPDPREQGTCLAALDPNLRTLKDGASIIPLSARFGSHRILKDDLVRTMSYFVTRVLSPKRDYPFFVAYLLFGSPLPPRAPLPLSALEAPCRPRSFAAPAPVPDEEDDEPDGERPAPDRSRFATWRALAARR